MHSYDDTNGKASLSIIIPVFNEEERIGNLIRFLYSCIRYENDVEVIVVDGGSNDQTVKIATHARAITLKSPKGRAIQMNCGASVAKGRILFFLHADTLPPKSFIHDIRRAVEEGYSAGCYRLSFDHNHWFLRLNSWFTRFDFNPFRFGDQGQFVTKDVFEKAGGFDENLELLEDQEIVRRIKQFTKFRIFDQAVRTSPRKYVRNGIFRLQLKYFLIYFLYSIGVSQNRLISIYRHLVFDERREEPEFLVDDATSTQRSAVGGD